MAATGMPPIWLDCGHAQPFELLGSPCAECAAAAAAADAAAAAASAGPSPPGDAEAPPELPGDPFARIDWDAPPDDASGYFGHIARALEALGGRTEFRMRLTGGADAHALRLAIRDPRKLAADGMGALVELDSLEAARQWWETMREHRANLRPLERAGKSVTMYVADPVYRAKFYSVVRGLRIPSRWAVWGKRAAAAATTLVSAGAAVLALLKYV